MPHNLEVAGLIPATFFIPDSASLAEASMLLASVAFVRHPFSRLASGYLEKLEFAQQVVQVEIRSQLIMSWAIGVGALPKREPVKILVHK